MSNLPKGTTLDNSPIIVESTISSHDHPTTDIIGLNSDLEGYVYAEKIDGVSYSDMLDTFISDSSNTMSGGLSSTHSPVSEYAMVRKSDVDNILLDNGIGEYELTLLPTPSVQSAPDSIVMTSSEPYIDTSWFSGFSGESSISLTESTIQVNSDSVYDIEITNFDSFSGQYNVSSTYGNVTIDEDTGLMTYSSPQTAPVDTQDIIQVSKSGSLKEVMVTVNADANMELTINGGQLTTGATITIDSKDERLIYIENYNPNYTYTVNSPDGVNFDILTDTITIIPPVTNNTVTYGSLIISRTPNDIVTLDVMFEEYVGKWVLSTVGGSSNDYYYSVTQSSDGGYVAVGNQASQSQGNDDALIVKYNSNLGIVEQVGLGGSGSDNYKSVIQSPDGGYVAVGNQNSQGQGGYDALIVKYDSNLDIVKQVGLGGSGSDVYQSVIQSSDGGYVAVGYQQLQGQGSYDALIVKYDSNLDVVKQVGLGDSSNDRYYSVIRSSDGGYVTVGYQQSQGQGGNDALIVKYDSNLDVVKQVGLGGSSNDIYYSVVQSSDGGYVAVGYQRSQGQGGSDALIVKHDSNLDIVKQVGLGGSSSDVYYSVTQSSDGGYVAVGDQYSLGQGGFDALIVKYDSNLDVVKQVGLGGSGDDTFRSVIQTSGGGYVAVGQQQSQSQGGFDALVTKIPDDFDLLAGPLSNHPGLSWTIPTLVETTPSLTGYNTTLVETIPTLNTQTPSLTEYTLAESTFIVTRSEQQ